MRAEAAARQRRHTLQFLEEIRQFSPVFLDTEVDMSRVLEHRSSRGRPYSLVTYVLYVSGRVLARHPDANAAIRGRIRPRVARYPGVDGKLTLDKTLAGRRIVAAAVLPGLDHISLEEIQRQVEHYRDGDAASMPELAPMRMLQRLPWPLLPAAYRWGVRPLSRRPAVFGTFAVTSLGHRPVDGFHSVGGTTITLGVGRVLDRPVVRQGDIVAAPVMRLNLAFDHRVIDGAEAADVLRDIKDGLEGFAPDQQAGSRQQPAQTLTGLDAFKDSCRPATHSVVTGPPADHAGSTDEEPPDELEPSMTIKRRGRQLIAGAAMLMAGGALLGAAASNTASASDRAASRAPGPGCITVRLVEPTAHFYSNIPYAKGDEFKVGFKGAAFDPAYDTAGKKIGETVVSTANFYKRPSDGHVFEYIADTLELNDGTIATGGAYDRVSVAHQVLVTGRATGLSGRYAGKYGTFTWRLASLKPPFPTRETAVLCPSR
jgi:hypothetical protein